MCWRLSIIELKIARWNTEILLLLITEQYTKEKAHLNINIISQWLNTIGVNFRQKYTSTTSKLLSQWLYVLLLQKIIKSNLFILDGADILK